MPKRFTDEEFIDAWMRYGSPRKIATALSLPVRSVHQRRRAIEARHGIALVSKIPATCTTGIKAEAGQAANRLAEDRARRYESEMHLEMLDGVVMIASDCHYWPGVVTPAHEAFCKLAKALKPDIVILNGDILDGARISRHSRIMWEKQPELKDELHAVQDRCAEIERAAGKAKLLRTIGNHDARFENYLSSNVPELEEMPGSTLIDYLPRWRAGWAVHLNAEQYAWTVIRHRPVGGGIHAAYNSALRAGTHYVHGHLHKLQYTPWSDYRGRRFGVDCGTMAEPKGPQFTYVEAGPLNWASGFVVLTYRSGRLLEPEIVAVDAGKAWFRGAPV
jgi:predicted phosphodiesterase